jgi:hypothetical protein
VGKIEELEPVLRESMEEAIKYGYLIVAKDWGICWDPENHLWIWDAKARRARGCCAIGSYLLFTQPALDPNAHKGDCFEAALAALQCNRWFLRDFMNGFDGYPMNAASAEDVYMFGRRLALVYRPIDIDILELQSEVRLAPIRLAANDYSEPDSAPDLSDQSLGL